VGAPAASEPAAALPASEPAAASTSPSASSAAPPEAAPAAEPVATSTSASAPVPAPPPEAAPAAEPAAASSTSASAPVPAPPPEAAPAAEPAAASSTPASAPVPAPPPEAAPAAEPAAASTSASAPVPAPPPEAAPAAEAASPAASEAAAPATREAPAPAAEAAPTPSPAGEARAAAEPIRAPTPPPEAVPASRAHDPEYQELWLALARKRWNSIVVVPADRSSSSETVAKALAEVGKELAEDPVTAITVSRLEYDQARTLTDLQLLVGKERERLAAEGPDPIVDVGRRRSEPITVVPPAVDGENPGQAIALVPRTRLVISIPPVVSEPLGVAVAQYADGVILTVHLGSTRLDEARRTIELIGRDRILGCFLVR